MFRTLIVVAAAALPASGEAAGQDAIKLGEPFKGEVTEQKGYPWPGFVDTYYGYATEVPVKLRGGQSLSVSGTVLGKGRKISIGLMDPAGKMVAATKRDTAVKSVTLTVEEVSATGAYKIVVVSDRIGDFTLRTGGPAEEELDEQALEEKIKHAEKELAALKARLKALRAKKP